MDTIWTERVHIEELMVQSEKMLTVGGLAAGRAHEINNPLGGMMQTASVMSRRLTDIGMEANICAAKEAGTDMVAISAFMGSRGIIRMLGRIQESGDRASEIVKNMPSFARKGDDSTAPEDMSKLLDQGIDLAGSNYDRKKNYDFRLIEILREYAQNLPLVTCGGGEIQQVF